MAASAAVSGQIYCFVVVGFLIHLWNHIAFLPKNFPSVFRRGEIAMH